MLQCRTNVRSRGAKPPACPHSPSLSLSLLLFPSPLVRSENSALSLALFPFLPLSRGARAAAGARRGRTHTVTYPLSEQHRGRAGPGPGVDGDKLTASRTPSRAATCVRVIRVGPEPGRRPSRLARVSSTASHTGSGTCWPDNRDGRPARQSPPTRRRPSADPGPRRAVTQCGS